MSVGLPPSRRKNREDFVGLDLSRRAGIKETITSKEPMWSDVFLSLVTGQASITLSIPFHDQILVGIFNIDNLQNAIEQARMSETIGTFVVDRQGALIFHPDRSVSRQKKSLRNIAPVAEGRQGRTGTYDFELDGDEYIGSVSLIPETDWLVILSQDKVSAYAPIRSVRNIFFMGMLAAIIVSIAVAAKLSRRLARPLAQLSLAAQAIAGGEYETELPPRQYGEIDGLAQSLRTMSSAIQKREETLKSLAESMAGLTGQECLERIVRETCKSVDAEIAMVGKIEGGATVRALAMVVDGEPIHNFSYSLNGAPCEKVIGEGRRFYPTNVRASFPQAKMLGEMNIEGFLGVPLHDSSGNPMGMLSAMSRRELRLPEMADDAISIIASRAAAEMERQLVEKKLRKSEERYREFIEGTEDIITRVDKDGKFLFVNQASQRVFGLTPEQCIGRSAFSFIHPDDREGTKKKFAECAGGRDLGFPLENRQVSVTGEIRHMLWTITPQRDDSGEIISVNSIARDITERRLAEKEKTGLEEQLRQSQKLEAIGQLAGGVAHDFNNLLTAILGYSQLALRKMPADSSAYQYLQEIEEAANRAADLTQQLLAFSRKQLLRPRLLDINQTLSGMNKMLRRLIREDIRFEAKSELHLWPIMADPGQMEQVIVNLVVNARDAMPSGGEITIETSNIALGEDSAHGHEDMKPGPFVMLSVTDTGHGMSEEVQSHIFEPFYTTKPEGEGTGLGLATIHGIIKQHGGDILVESMEGVGTTFKIYLPASMSDIEKEPEEREAPPMPRGSETILFVEDEDSVRNLGVEALTDLGYVLIEAPDGPHAIRLLEENNLIPDLMVTDIIMPGMSGEDLAMLYRRRFPGGKVLFTSGYTDHALQEDGVLKPGVELLRKPFTPSMLAGEVRRMLDK